MSTGPAQRERDVVLVRAEQLKHAGGAAGIHGQGSEVKLGGLPEERRAAPGYVFAGGPAPQIFETRFGIDGLLMFKKDRGSVEKYDYDANGFMHQMLRWMPAAPPAPEPGSIGPSGSPSCPPHELQYASNKGRPSFQEDLGGGCDGEPFGPDSPKRTTTIYQDTLPSGFSGISGAPTFYDNHALIAQVFPDGDIDTGTSVYDCKTFGRNSLGETTHYRDQAGNVMQTTFNAAGRPSSIYFPNVVSGFDGRVRTVNMTYDGLGRLTQMTQLNSGSAVVGALGMSYDQWLRLKQFRQDPDSGLDGGTGGNSGVPTFDYGITNQLLASTGGDMEGWRGVRTTGMLYPPAPGQSASTGLGVHLDIPDDLTPPCTEGRPDHRPDMRMLRVGGLSVDSGGSNLAVLADYGYLGAATPAYVGLTPAALENWRYHPDGILNDEPLDTGLDAWGMPTDWTWRRSGGTDAPADETNPVLFDRFQTGWEPSGRASFVNDLGLVIPDGRTPNNRGILHDCDGRMIAEVLSPKKFVHACTSSEDEFCWEVDDNTASLWAGAPTFTLGDGEHATSFDPSHLGNPCGQDSEPDDGPDCLNDGFNNADEASGNPCSPMLNPPPLPPGLPAWLDDEEHPDYEPHPGAAHDANGNTTADGYRWNYSYDAQNRPTEARYQRPEAATVRGGEEDVYARFTYDALGRRSTATYDTHASGGGGGTDPIGDGAIGAGDRVEVYAYDPRWRLIAIYRTVLVSSGGGGGALVPDSSALKLYQQYVYHENEGGNPDVPAMFKVDTDADGALDKTLYYLTNHRGDVVGLVEDVGEGSTSYADVVERVRYSAYGVPRTCVKLDVNLDGAVDSQDYYDLVNAIGGETFALDYNRDGAVDSQDFFDFLDDSMDWDEGATIGEGPYVGAYSPLGTGGGTGGDGHLSNYDNRIGYGSYVWDPYLGVYHVRNRTYDPFMHRWLTRDPIGYAGGLNLYEYCGGDPYSNVDPMGLGPWDRFWGVLKTAGGALETGAGVTVGVAVGWTGFGAAGAAVLIVHGADTAQAGARQAFSGKPTQTLTSTGVAAGAGALGASPEAAHAIGEGVDAAIGLVTIFVNPASGAKVATVVIPGIKEAVVVTETGAITTAVTTSGTVVTLTAQDAAAIGALMHAAANVGSIEGDKGSEPNANVSADPPRVPKYPSDPTTPPEPGFVWRTRDNSPPGSGRGSWVNPHTNEVLHPDLQHGPPIGPHYDWTDCNGKIWRMFPDGRLEPKQ